MGWPRGSWSGPTSSGKTQARLGSPTPRFFRLRGASAKASLTLSPPLPRGHGLDAPTLAPPFTPEPSQGARTAGCPPRDSDTFGGGSRETTGTGAGGYHDTTSTPEGFRRGTFTSRGKRTPGGRARKTRTLLKTLV